MFVVLDSGAVTRLAERSSYANELTRALRRGGYWPPRIPVVVLVECLQGHAGKDALANALLKACDVTDVPEPLARRAALLRRRARAGSAVDALVVATAEHGGTVFTTDLRDLEALASHASDVKVESI